MRTTDAIQHAGTATALAKLLNITLGAISQWGEFPPDNRQLQIEKLTNYALKAEQGCMDRILCMAKTEA